MRISRIQRKQILTRRLSLAVALMLVITIALFNKNSIVNSYNAAKAPIIYSNIDIIDAELGMSKFTKAYKEIPKNYRLQLVNDNSKIYVVYPTSSHLNGMEYKVNANNAYISLYSPESLRFVVESLVRN